ncbi:MAG: DEAD/DEAH box helicase [Bacteriovoracaceae bacterium]|nr:DEAD/DEAH box helicase [Bacteriovoracaceae bacterium]
MTFQELPLRESLIRAITERGYVEPTDIQAEAIPALATTDTDFVGQAQTGTGKTAAFVLPLLHKVDPNNRDVQALILTPTRELANQITEEIKKFAKYEKTKTIAVYGGVSTEAQIRGLRKDRPQIVVGTPGRVLDLIERGVLILDNAKFAVLDEADEMLDMGFIDDVKQILSNLGESRKTWMFSATMPAPILSLIKTYLKDPLVVKVKKTTLSNESIEQKHYVVRHSHMSEAICRILDSLDDYYGMIFCRTKIDAKTLADELNSRGYPSDSMHGDMSQQQRDITMKNFKLKKINMLVCTDVAARGIDVDNLTHVINYGLPQDIESYVHRIGRTGRAGLKGVAITLVEPSERYRLRMVENNTKAKIVQATLPTPTELKQVLVRKEIKKFDTLIEKLDRLETDAVFSEKFADMEKADLLKVMYNHLFASQITRYDHAPSLEVAERRPDTRDNRDNRDMRDNRNDSRDSRGNSRDQAPMARSNNGNMRFFVNIGKDHGLTLKSLLGSISDMVKVDERMIRNVDMKETFSFLEVPEQFGEVLLKTNNPMIIERNVRFELTRSAPMSRPSYGGGDRDRRPSFRSGSANRNSNGGGGAGFANRSEAKPERSFRS